MKSEAWRSIIKFGIANKEYMKEYGEERKEVSGEE
jgi:hypothetical protein